MLKQRTVVGAMIATLLCPLVYGQSRPEGLLALEQSRRRIRTAQIEWSTEVPKLVQVPGMEQGARRTFRTTRLAENGVLEIDRGDAEGVVSRASDGTPAPVDQRPKQYLVTGKDVWQNQAGAIDASLRPVGASYRPPDLRSLGMSAFFDTNPMEMILWFDGTGGPTIREYTESRDGDLHIITAKSAYARVSWWLDPSKDWNPVRVAAYDGEGVVYESRTSYEKTDGTWFPKTVAFFSRDYKGGKVPGRVVTIQHVSINQPDDPKQLTPVDMGIDVGTSVDKYGQDGKLIGTFMFDGTEPVALSDYNRRVKAGELKIGPAVLAEMERLLNLPQNAAARRVMAEGDADPWYRYTTQVIERYALTGEQTQKARLICLDCQQRRNSFLRAKSVQLDAAQTATVAARNAEPFDQEAADKADQRFMDLLSPVTEIFEMQLKPRLDRLPTRSQRDAADAREKTTGSTKK